MESNKNTVRNFYPGPSRLPNRMPIWLAEAYESGILSRNHRSEEFMQLYAQLTDLLRDKLNLPAGYRCILVSSATQCRQITGQWPAVQKSVHFFNGAFGQKWFEARKNTIGEGTEISFGINEKLPLEKIALLEDNKHLLFCLTDCETSNGTQIPEPVYQEIRQEFPESLISSDATSSLGGRFLNLKTADIWFASVQKCFGLPSGAALLFVSEKAAELSREFPDKSRYDSMEILLQNSEKKQTAYTPNILTVFLLVKLLSERKPAETVGENLKNRAEKMYAFIEQLNLFSPLISNKNLRSETVLAVKGKPEHIRPLHREAEAQGFVFGKGYGDLKETTFRLANFPAIPDEDFDDLKIFLDYFENKFG